MIVRRRRRPEGAQSFESINITPFTDVLLVLLIIFMIAGSAMVPTGLTVTAIETREVGDESSAEAAGLIVEIDAEGAVRWMMNGAKLSWAEVRQLSSSTTCTLSIAPDASAQRIVAEYDKLLEAGLRNIVWAAPRSMERQ